MRYVQILFIIVVSSVIWTQAQDGVISVAGNVYEKKDDKKNGVNGCVVKLYILKGEMGNNTTSNDGIFLIYDEKKSIEVSVIKEQPWHVICNLPGKLGRENVHFDLLQGSSNHYSAKVNIHLRSTVAMNYSLGESADVITTIFEVASIRARAGEFSETEANELASKQAAIILGRTEVLKETSREDTVKQVNQLILKKYDNSIPQLPVLQTDNFLRLQNRIEFENSIMEKSRFSETKTLNPESQYNNLLKRFSILDKSEIKPNITYYMCLDTPKHFRRCGDFSGNDRDDLKDKALITLCDGIIDCIKKSDGSNLLIAPKVTTTLLQP